MPPVNDLSKLTKEDLLNKCRKFNIPVGTLTKGSRTKLECKLRSAMQEERGKKYFDKANNGNNSMKDAPDDRKTVRPSRIPVMIRSHGSDEGASPSPRAFFEDSNDSGIQLASTPIVTKGDGLLGIPNDWESLYKLKKSLMEDYKEFEENEFENPDQVTEEELPLSGYNRRQLKLNESEDEDKEDDAFLNNAEKDDAGLKNAGKDQNLNLQTKLFSAGLILVTGIIFYYIWKNVLF